MPIFLATLATSHAIVAPTPPVPPEQASHVLLAIEEYRALAEAASKAAPPRSEVDQALAILSDPNEQWTDAEDLAAGILRDGLGAIRKRLDLTQAELGEVLGVPQSRVSRLESNLDATTVRVVRQIAERLAARFGGDEPRS
ncbi:MAG: helix-turn-helix transcriptional regulator [Phycisphaerales bacterium]